VISDKEADAGAAMSAAERPLNQFDYPPIRRSRLNC
jgi:hypothetical protein